MRKEGKKAEVKKVNHSDNYILAAMDNMCAESFDPHYMELWDMVKEELILRRILTLCDLVKADHK